jgi:hypothetical protein
VSYLKSFGVGLGMYVLAVGSFDVLGWIYLQVRWRHELASGKLFIVAKPVFMPHSKWTNFYTMLPLIIGHVIGIAAFVAAFYWMFRRTSARNSN